MDLTQNYYDIFGLPQAFRVDRLELSDRYRRLQREFHPDRFLNCSASEQRLSVQFASLINNAYQTLKSPLLSAQYLLRLSGVDVDQETLTISDASFLMMQMEWREALADLSEALKAGHQQPLVISEQLDRLRQTSIQERDSLIEAFEAFYDQQQWSKAVELVAKLHFVEKILLDIDQLDDECLS